MKSNLAKFLDNLFTAAAVWLLSAIIGLYFLDKLYLVVIFATVVTMGISLLLNLRGKKALAVLEEKHKAQLTSDFFLLCDDRFVLDYFADALSKRYKTSKHKFYIKINNTFVVPCLGEPLPLKKLVFYYSEALRLGAKTLVLLAGKTEKFAINPMEKLTDIRLEIFDGILTYRLLKSLGSVPPIRIQKRKLKLKEFFVSALHPKRSKGYLFSAFALIFGAYFSMMSLYFIVAAAVCLTLVVLCKFNLPKKVKKKGS